MMENVSTFFSKYYVFLKLDIYKKVSIMEIVPLVEST